LSDSFNDMGDDTAADDEPRVEVDDSADEASEPAEPIEAAAPTELPDDDTTPTLGSSDSPTEPDAGDDSEPNGSDPPSTAAPMDDPTDEPTSDPTDDPTDPADDPTSDPTMSDGDEPTLDDADSGNPTSEPTDGPTTEPTPFEPDASTGEPEPTTTETDETTVEEDAGPPDLPPEPLLVVNRNPLQDAMDADPAANVVLEFDLPISLGAGTLVIVDLDADVEVETISVSDPRVSLTEDSVSIDLDSILMGGTAYSVTVPAGAFQGSGGEVFEGATWSFQTQAVDIPGGGSASDVLLWLDADYTPSIKLASNALRLWADRSGHRNNLAQATAANRPTVVSNSLGGNPVVRFDGAGDFLLGPDLDDPSAYDLFVVWRSPAVPTDELTLLVTNGVFETCNLQMTYGHSVPGYEHSAVAQLGDTFAFAAFDVPAVDTAALWNASFTGSNLVAYTDGTQTTSTATTGELNAATERFALAGTDGGQFTFGGDVAELLLFSRALNATERNLVEEYLETKWALTLAE
jgi:hypothetical protein